MARRDRHHYDWVAWYGVKDESAFDDWRTLQRGPAQGAPKDDPRRARLVLACSQIPAEMLWASDHVLYERMQDILDVDAHIVNGRANWCVTSTKKRTSHPWSIDDEMLPELLRLDVIVTFDPQSLAYDMLIAYYYDDDVEVWENTGCATQLEVLDNLRAIRTLGIHAMRRHAAARKIETRRQQEAEEAALEEMFRKMP